MAMTEEDRQRWIEALRPTEDVDRPTPIELDSIRGTASRDDDEPILALLSRDWPFLVGFLLDYLNASSFVRDATFAQIDGWVLAAADTTAQDHGTGVVGR